MIISNYKKLKYGQYELTLDTQKIRLHEDIILKYQLLLTKEISKEVLANLLIENQSYQAYEIALQSLNSKQRTYQELYELLKKKDFSSDMINTCLEKLQNQGYINHSIYAESYLHDRMLMSFDGPYKISQNLKKKGLEESCILTVLSKFTKTEQENRIIKIIEKKIKVNHNKSKKSLFQKIQIYLQQLGYDRILISNILVRYQIDDDAIKKSEYEKLHRKLSRKYQGDELDIKIRQKMFQKGFSTDE